MKHHLTLAAALLCMLSLNACSQSNPEQEPSQSANTLEIQVEKILDVNQDGTLAPAELQQVRQILQQIRKDKNPQGLNAEDKALVQSLRQIFDTNQDQTLSKEERQAGRAAIQNVVQQARSN